MTRHPRWQAGAGARANTAWRRRLLTIDPCPAPLVRFHVVDPVVVHVGRPCAAPEADVDATTIAQAGFIRPPDVVDFVIPKIEATASIEFAIGVEGVVVPPPR